jgi:hypothetical protein
MKTLLSVFRNKLPLLALNDRETTRQWCSSEVRSYYSTTLVNLSGFHDRDYSVCGLFWVLTPCTDIHPQDYTVSNPWRPHDFSSWLFKFFFI